MTLLKTQHLSIQAGSHRICQHLNFALHPGEIWGIIGPNGVGKTTLLHTLAGIHQATAGTISLDGCQLQTLSAKTIAKQLGILFQQSYLPFPQTVLEYITASRFPHLPYFGSVSKQDSDIIDAALNHMALSPLRQRLIQTLSGGEQRRVGIAALLAQTPRIYLLDEPTNHLDLRYQLLVLTHFKQLAERKQAGIMMALHDINHIQTFCTHVLLLFSDGRMQQGKVYDILSEESLSQLYGVKIREQLWQFVS